jgi:hypothetical protein
MPAGLKEVHTAVQYMALKVAEDDRWLDENDTFGVSIAGFVLYGFGLKCSKIFECDSKVASLALTKVMKKVFECQPKWTAGFIEEAEKSAVDENYHPGQFELIEVGKGYELALEVNREVENVYANIRAFRSTSDNNRRISKD